MHEKVKKDIEIQLYCRFILQVKMIFGRSGSRVSLVLFVDLFADLNALVN